LTPPFGYPGSGRGILYGTLTKDGFACNSLPDPIRAALARLRGL